MATAEQLQSIEITDVGPITNLSIPVPSEGGLVCIRAANGSGKTHALDSVRALVGGGKKLPVRDAAKRGSIVGLGSKVNVTFTRSTSSGSLEMVDAESGFDVSDLACPTIKDPAARNRHRIKALVQLAGAKADPTLFHDLFGGEDGFKDVISAESYETDDLVVMAEKLKRDIEKKARECETSHEREMTHAKSFRAAASGVDIEQEHDRELLQFRLEKAIQVESELKAQAANHAESLRQAAEAEQRLSEIKPGTTAESIQAKLVELEQQIRPAIEDNIKALEEHLAKARQQLSEVDQEKRNLESQLDSAKSTEQALSACKQQIEAAKSCKAVSTEELEAARQAVELARYAIEQGVTVRDAKQKLDQADEHVRKAIQHQKLADQYRNAAKGIDDVLSEVVKSLNCGLSVHRGMLVTPTDRDEREQYDELSEGERWHIAIDLLIARSKKLEAQTGKRAIFTINQEAFQGLDWQRRNAIAKQLQGTGVVMIAAECSRTPGEDQLHAEVIG